MSALWKKTGAGVLAVLLAARGAGAGELWDLPPIRHAERAAGDAMSGLARELAAGRRGWPEGSGLGFLQWLLERLRVPRESQVLVFSKTSLQNDRIHPGNPRALFFSENTYVGYVPGGSIEVIAHDPELGPVFHVVSLRGGSEPPVVTRETACFSCHGNARTEDVPGMLVRSVFPDADGRPVLGHGSFLITHESPVRERWGGYYVTGTVGQAHFGNRFFREDETPRAADGAAFDLTKRIDVTKYPRAGSDVVALLVLEHQCRMHNLLTAAALRYRRAHWLAKSVDPAGDPDAGTAGRVADTAAAAIVEALLFKGEADLGDGVEGDPAFQQAFEARFPRTKQGASLADFRLYGRLFKNRCSYMVYSDAFRALPPRVKSAVIGRLREVLEAAQPLAGFEWLAASERQRIAAILRETLDGYGA
jgi:hypothetical protein